MSQSSRQKYKLCLVRSSPDDNESKAINEAMGMTVADFMSVLGSEPGSHAKQSWKHFVWPRHTKQELYDPMQMVYRHEPSDKSWSLQYKALGCYEYVPLHLTCTFSRETPKLGETTSNPSSADKSAALTAQLNCKDLVETVNEKRSLEKPSVETITAAQRQELRQTLSLSDSPDDSDSDIKKLDQTSTAPQRPAVSASSKTSSNQCKKLVDSLERRMPGVIPMVSPLQVDAMIPRLTSQSRVVKQNSRELNGFTSCKAVVDMDASMNATVPDLGTFAKFNSLTQSQESTRSKNQENVPTAAIPFSSSSTTAISTEKPKRKVVTFVRRVLAEADAFYRPFRRLPDIFLDDIANEDSFVEGGELENVPSGEKSRSKLPMTAHQQHFSLKRISPLPRLHNRFLAPKGEEPSAPLPNKQRKSLLDVPTATPMPSNPPPLSTKDSKTTTPCSQHTRKTKSPEEPKPVHITPSHVEKITPNAATTTMITPQQQRQPGELSRGRDSWVTPSISASELRPRLASILIPPPFNCLSSPQPVDKLKSLRFILRSLPFTGSQRPSNPDLCGVLLAPGSFGKGKRASVSVTTTPQQRRSAVGVQWEPFTGGTASTHTQVSPRVHVSVVTNTSPPRVRLQQASVGVGTEGLTPPPPTPTTFVVENGVSIDKCSVEECLDKILKHNQKVMESTTKCYEQSTEEQELTRATALDEEASQCWSQLVAYVAATSSSTAASAPPMHRRPFICQCASDNARLLHCLFNQTDFTAYPERVLSSTRHLLIWASMATSVVESKRRYDQALAGLARTASRMRRAESKLIRRAWVAIQKTVGAATATANFGPPPASALANLGATAKNWSDLWYSALSRVNSVVTEKVYQLLAENERQLRQKIDDDASLKSFHQLLTDDHFLLGDSPASSSNSLSMSVGQIVSPGGQNLMHPHHHRTSTPASSSSTNDRPNGDIPHYSGGTGLNEDHKSSVCTIPRATLERLFKVFQMTSLAHESWKARLESEQILSSGRYAVFGSSTSSASPDHLPVYVGPAPPSSNISSLIVYIDSVIRHHQLIVARLAACPDAPASNLSSSCSLPAEQSPSTAARWKSSSGVVTAKKLQPPPPEQQQQPSPPLALKRKRLKSPPPLPPPPPAFEDLPIRPPTVRVEKVSVVKKHKSRHQKEAAGAFDGDATITANTITATAPVPNRMPVIPKIPKKKSMQDDSRLGESIRQDRSSLSSQASRRDRSRSRSVAPRERDRFDGGESDSEELSAGREREQKLGHRGRSVAPSKRELKTLPCPNVVEAYSPGRNTAIGSYSPTRPSFTNEAMHPRLSSSHQHPDYIPSAPISSKGGGAERRSVLSELPSKAAVQQQQHQPAFSSKWLDGGSSSNSSRR